ncbi:MAG: class I SAM-dependent methyltransferase [Alphaproteobacteria bacterium]|nr:class I SAM-dependent methyltransferase [Alphaproteobacteria bacterium]
MAHATPDRVPGFVELQLMPSTDVQAPLNSLKGLGRHEMMAKITAEEEARLNYQMTLSRILRETVQPGNRQIYDARVEPKFVKEHGRKPKDRHEVRKAMLADPAYQWWASMRRQLQEQGGQWKQPIIERQLHDLVAKAKIKAPKYSTLRLDPKLELPRYQTTFDMHWMAGGYHSERICDDVYAGAMYDLGGLYMGTGGKMGPYNDGPGWSVVNWLKSKYPKFTPKKVVDEGCTVGHSTMAYVDAWPKAEVHGIDFAAPILRYAHARAEFMKKPVHFSQQLAEKTNFSDNSVDLVVSSMFLHETSHKAVYKIVAEAHRMLKPGGLMVHVEQPQFRFLPTPWAQFENDWDTHNNNEPFWGPMHDMDLEDVARTAGFTKKDVIQESAPFVMPLADGTKHVAAKGTWFFFAAWKR